MKNGNIISFLSQHPEHNRIQCIIEVANGLDYLHSHKPPVIHADIRGANILVNADFRCCLADFGLAKAVMTCGFGSYGDSRKGSSRWLAPELLQVDASSNWQYQTFRDIYAFGCTVIEIFTGRIPFWNIKQDIAVMLAVWQNDLRPARPSYDELPYDSVWSLVELCWSRDVHRRPSSSSLVAQLTNLDLSRRIFRKKKSVSKSIKTMVISQHNIRNHQKLGIGRHFRCQIGGCNRSFLSSSVRRKHKIKCRKATQETVSVL
ncbi:kinase-like domain-containing protein [Desarmillaria tabescens]|uniref:Kinase-like domain-containing protein n=1 Tax=Armillaria tabescens TaxID=1929756 RepID=A0AA39JA37_ARMTA|nr:kinase-like domain-containing protein [Desarmillaria tabescens]KAK0437589.1 kinase-like domain-containing protein [Desarmillaria tabescens]